MKKTFCLIFFILIFSNGFSQQKKDSIAKAPTIGFEIDLFPYLTGGYYGSAWIGYKQMRCRLVITSETTPQFLVPDGFTNNKIHAYALIADYFFKPGFKAWWVGSGFEYWSGQIQTDAKVNTADYDNVYFTIGGGYVWKFYKNFYLNPWTAGHFRIGGDKEVMVDGQKFSPPAILPEISVKVGWSF
jgi:hypothetical protein